MSSPLAWIGQSPSRSRTEHSKHSASCVFPTEALAAIQWPIHSITLEDSGEWMACHCADDQILIYCCARGSFINQPLAYPDDNPPVLFTFTRLPSTEGSQLHFIVLTSGGRLTTLNIDSNMSKNARLSEVPLLGASVQELSSQGRRLLIATDQADLLSLSWTGGEWVQSVSQLLPLPTDHGRMRGRIQLDQYHELGPDVLVVTTSRQIVFLDSPSLAVLGKLDVGEGEHSISHAMFGQTAQCLSCGGLAFPPRSPGWRAVK